MMHTQVSCTNVKHATCVSATLTCIPLLSTLLHSPCYLLCWLWILALDLNLVYQKTVGWFKIKTLYFLCITPYMAFLHSSTSLTCLLHMHTYQNSSSSGIGPVVVPMIKSKVNKAGSVFYDLSCWDTLPDCIRCATTLTMQKSRLKTFVFPCAFD